MCERDLCFIPKQKEVVDVVRCLSDTATPSTFPHHGEQHWSARSAHTVTLPSKELFVHQTKVVEAISAFSNSLGWEVAAAVEKKKVQFEYPRNKDFSCGRVCKDSANGCSKYTRGSIFFLRVFTQNKVFGKSGVPWKWAYHEVYCQVYSTMDAQGRSRKTLASA